MNFSNQADYTVENPMDLSACVFSYTMQFQMHTLALIWDSKAINYWEYTTFNCIVCGQIHILNAQNNNWK